MPRLNNEERNQAIGMLNAGMSATVVSQPFGCARKTIERLWRRFRVTRNVADRPRRGRPRVTNAAYDRYIVLQHLLKRRLTAAATGRQYGIHPQTVRNRLRLNVQPIHAYRPYISQILTRRHRMARRDWCRRHLHFRRADWDLSLFSDEFRFNSKKFRRSYRRRGEHFADVCLIERFGGGSVLVWGGIMGGNKPRLIVSNGNIIAHTYINDVLAVEALPFIQFHSQNVTFVHDNARPHSAAITRQFLATNVVIVLDWPANSPDLNPLEISLGQVRAPCSKKSCNTHCK